MYRNRARAAHKLHQQSAPPPQQQQQTLGQQQQPPGGFIQQQQSQQQSDPSWGDPITLQQQTQSVKHPERLLHLLQSWSLHLLHLTCSLATRWAPLTWWITGPTPRSPSSCLTSPLAPVTRWAALLTSPGPALTLCPTIAARRLSWAPPVCLTWRTTGPSSSL